MAEVVAFRNNALPYPVYGVPYTVVAPVLDADGDPVATGTMSSTVSINGDTAGAGATPVQIPTNTGAYYVILTAAQMTADIVTVTIASDASGSKTTILVLYPRKLVTLASGTCQHDGNTARILLAAGTVLHTGQYAGCLCVATINSLIEARILQSSAVTTELCNVTPAWNVHPAATDTYVIYLPEGIQIPTVNVKAVSDDATAADNLESACDNYSVTRGLSGTALPAVAAGAKSGLPILDASTGLILTGFGGGAVTASPTTGSIITASFGTCVTPETTKTALLPAVAAGAKSGLPILDASTGLILTGYGSGAVTVSPTASSIVTASFGACVFPAGSIVTATFGTCVFPAGSIVTATFGTCVPPAPSGMSTLTQTQVTGGAYDLTNATFVAAFKSALGTVPANVSQWLDVAPLALSSQQVQAIVPTTQKVDVETIKARAVTDVGSGQTVYLGTAAWSTVSTVTGLSVTLSGLHGSGSWATATGFATAAICTEGRLAELDAAHLPTVTDAILADTGTDGVVLAAAYDLYTAHIELTIDEANSKDEWTIIWFKNGARVTSGITVSTIQIVKRADGADLVAAVAMTQIGTTGAYKYDATTTSRTTAGEAVLAVVAATIDAASRSFAKVITRDSAAA